jgi:hypothetical protein
MSDQAFSDQLPASYAEKYGQTTLRDHSKPRIEAATKDIARRQAEKTVADLRERIPGLRG